MDSAFPIVKFDLLLPFGRRILQSGARFRQLRVTDFSDGPSTSSVVDTPFEPPVYGGETSLEIRERRRCDRAAEPLVERRMHEFVIYAELRARAGDQSAQFASYAFAPLGLRLGRRSFFGIGGGARRGNSLR